MNDLTNIFWNEHFRDKNRAELSKIKQKVYDWLNEDNFGGFGIEGKYFWIETTCSTAKIYNYIRNYMIKWANKKGYKYTYSL